MGTSPPANGFVAAGFGLFSANIGQTPVSAMPCFAFVDSSLASHLSQKQPGDPERFGGDDVYGPQDSGR